MEQKETFNLSANLFGGYTSIFIKLVFVIISVYLIIMIMNFLRDKFINKKTDTPNDDIADLLTILNKLFLVSGFGFVVGNIFHYMFTQVSSEGNYKPLMNFNDEWNYLTFGIILIFIGIGFKVGKNVLKKERIEK